MQNRTIETNIEIKSREQLYDMQRVEKKYVKIGKKMIEYS